MRLTWSEQFKEQLLFLPFLTEKFMSTNQQTRQLSHKSLIPPSRRKSYPWRRSLRYNKFSGCLITGLWSEAAGEHRRRVQSMLRSDSTKPRESVNLWLPGIKRMPGQMFFFKLNFCWVFYNLVCFYFVNERSRKEVIDMTIKKVAKKLSTTCKCKASCWSLVRAPSQEGREPFFDLL